MLAYNLNLQNTQLIRFIALLYFYFFSHNKNKNDRQANCCKKDFYQTFPSVMSQKIIIFLVNLCSLFTQRQFLVFIFFF